jgi:hypothetical protein
MFGLMVRHGCLQTFKMKTRPISHHHLPATLNSKTLDGASTEVS